MKTNAIKERFMNEVAKMWGKDSSMMKYMSKDYTPYETKSGYLFEMQRPSIETTFWVGYSSCGQGMEFEDACKCVRNIDKHIERYFLSKNLEQYDTMLKTFKGYLKNGTKVYWVRHYIDHDVNIFDWHDEQYYWHYHWEQDKQVAEMSKQDIKDIIVAIKAERDKFEKRLNAYLKRYGTSKLSSSYYWIDE